MAEGRWTARWRGVRGIFPLTGGGLLVGLLGLWAVWRMGFGSQDLILLLVGGVGLLLLAWSLLGTVLGAARLALALRREASSSAAAAGPLEAECGRPVRLEFSVPSLWWLPFIALTWTWVHPPVEVVLRDQGGRRHERVTPRRRGVYDAIVRELEVGDVFGLAAIRFRHTQAAALRVLPATGALRDVRVVRGLAGGDALSHPDGEPVGERVDMRRYGEGDPIRYVLWKVYARTREVMVRTPERSFSPSRQTVAYLVSGEGDPPAAGAARVAVESGAMGGDWLLGADGAGQIADAPAAALELILRSAASPAAAAGEGLARFLDAAEVGSGRRAMVFVPARPGPWMARVLAAAGPSDPSQPGRLEFMVCVDGLQRPATAARAVRARLGRWLLRPPPAPSGDVAPAAWEDLQEVLRTLGQSGSRISIVDRAAGTVFSPDQLQRR